MLRYTVDELAERAGMTLEDVQGLIDAGVLEPAADGTVPVTALNRVRLAHALTQDIPLADLARAIESESLHFRFVDALFANPVPLEALEFEEIGEIPLKGVQEPVALYRALNRHDSGLA